MILTEINAGHARLALRFYFILVLAIVTSFSEKVLLARARLQVIRNGSVPINRTVGWIQGGDLFKALWRLRTLPGGKLGFPLMVLVFSLAKITDLVTTARVQPVEVQSRCDFGTGMIFNLTYQTLPFPPVNSRATLWASNAQYTSMGNSLSYSFDNQCEVGIYTKVNTDSSFCADEFDTFGTWVCTAGANVTYQRNVNQNTLTLDLQNQGVLYNNASAYYWNVGSNYGGCPGQAAWNQYVGWSSSAASDSAKTVWDVKAVFQSNFDPCADIELMTVDCTMEAPGAEFVQSRIQSVSALKLWVSYVQGLMYSGSYSLLVPTLTDELEIVLNTMIMVQGGGNFLLWDPTNFQLDNGGVVDPKQGCLILGTIIPAEVEFLVLFVALMMVAIVVTYLIYHFKVLRHARDNKEASKHVPGDVVTWAALAAKEHQNRQVTHRPYVLYFLIRLSCAM
jgi:hypothetical protein